MTYTAPYTAPEASFIDRISQALKTYADSPCVKFGNEEYTYKQVDKISSYIASELVKSGFGQGDHGAIYSLNSARVLIVTLGILRAGGVWIPVNPRNTEAENIRALTMLNCKTIFYQSDFHRTVAEVSENIEGELLSFDIDAPNYSEDSVPNADAPTLDTSLEDLVSLPLTGGTTGVPKAVMLSNANFNAMAYGVSQWYRNYKRPPLTLCVAPMTHVGGRIALTSMISGSGLLVHESFHAIDVLTAIEQERVTDIFLPPTAIYSLLEEPSLTEFDLSSLHTMLYGSAPMSIDQLKQALQIFGPVMRNAYGQTECPTFITELTPEDHFIDGELAPDERLQSVGRATKLSDIAIVDDSCNPVIQGELGEVAVKGPMACKGYYQSAEETAKIKVGGWHLTGDIGYLDTEGFLHLVDRKKDMIVSGGFNVYSAEVEQVINKIQGVRSCQVIGVPSDRWGEEVKALVQLKSASKLSEHQIISICRDELGSIKAPKSIEFRNEFPLTPLGKVDKKAMRAEFWVGKTRNI